MFYGLCRIIFVLACLYITFVIFENGCHVLYGCCHLYILILSCHMLCLLFLIVFICVNGFVILYMVLQFGMCLFLIVFMFLSCVECFYNLSYGV